MNGLPISKNSRADSTVSGVIPLIQAVATLLVVAIHYRSAPPPGSGSVNAILQELICNGVARVAVPLFALISGYLFFLGYDGVPEWVDKIRRRIKTLLVPYMCASTGVLVFLFVSDLALGKPRAVSGWVLVRDWIVHPGSDQLWYLRDLMLLVLAAPLIRYLLGVVGVGFVLAAGAAWFLNVEVLPRAGGWRLISIETLFFFVAGGYLASHQNWLRALITAPASWRVGLFLLWIALLGIRVTVAPSFSLWYADRPELIPLALQKTAILAGGLWLITAARFLRNPFFDCIAGCSFFLYLYHLNPLKTVLNKVPLFSLGPEYAFYVHYPVVIASVLAACFCLRRGWPSLYGVLTGDRGRSKGRPETAATVLPDGSAANH